MNQIINKALKRKILLNPGPATTSVRVKKALLIPDICPRERELGQVLNSVTRKILQVVKASEEEYGCVLLPGSGTGVMESSLSSSVDSCDGILILENGAYGARMEEICKTHNIRFHTLKFPWGAPLVISQIEDFLSREASKYRVLTFVHHETTTGLVNPLPELQALTEKYGLVCLVDAMSSYAGVPIDLGKDKVDYLLSSSNKCIQGMAGLGIIIVKFSELEKIKNFKKKSFSLDLTKNYFSQKEKKQFLFTPPVQILYALEEALDEFFDEGGIEKRSQRYERLYQIMLDGMLFLGFSPFLEKEYHSKILTSFLEPQDPRYSFQKLHDDLYEKGFTIYPGKVKENNTFRISNIGDLQEEDMRSFIRHMETCLFKFGIQLK